jgi:peptidoglycan/LPS O-acetylase OafA/YrhL
MMQSSQPRQLNLVAALAAVAGVAVALVDMLVVAGSSTQDDPWQGLLLGLLPAVAATLFVYPTVSWLSARGVSPPNEVRDEIVKLREEISALRRQLPPSRE